MILKKYLFVNCRHPCGASPTVDNSFIMFRLVGIGVFFFRDKKVSKVYYDIRG